MKKLPISLCIVTYNSVDRLEKMVNKHKDFVSEILIIDQSSVDGTWDVVKKIADIPIRRRNKGAADPDRNWLFSMARHPWVLYLDDDEYLDKECIEVLPELLKDNIDIYWLKTRNLIDGKDIKVILGDDFHPRLFRRGRLRYLDQATSLDHTYPQPADRSSVAFVNYYIVHARSLEKMKRTNRARNKIATPQQVEMQENFIQRVETFMEKQKNKD